VTFAMAVTVVEIGLSMVMVLPRVANTVLVMASVDSTVVVTELILVSGCTNRSLNGGRGLENIHTATVVVC
jgi:hypothetical protein